MCPVSDVPPDREEALRLRLLSQLETAIAQAESAHTNELIPNPDDQFGTALAGMPVGHQPKWVAVLMVFGMSARVRQRLLRAASRSLRVAKCLFATASSASGHRCSAGCSSGV